MGRVWKLFAQKSGNFCCSPINFDQILKIFRPQNIFSRKKKYTYLSSQKKRVRLIWLLVLWCYTRLFCFQFPPQNVAKIRFFLSKPPNFFPQIPFQCWRWSSNFVLSSSGIRNFPLFLLHNPVFSKVPFWFLG